MNLKRYAPCPILMHPFLHPDVPEMRKEGLLCMGPYANDKWYIFHPKKPRADKPTPVARVYSFAAPTLAKEK